MGPHPHRHGGGGCCWGSSSRGVGSPGVAVSVSKGQARVKFARGCTDSIHKSLVSLESPKHSPYRRIYCWVFIFCSFKGSIWIWFFPTHAVLQFLWTEVRFLKWASLTKNPCAIKIPNSAHLQQKKEHAFPVLSLLPLAAGEHFAVFLFGGCRGCRGTARCLLLLLWAWNAITCLSAWLLILHDKTKKQRQNWISRLVSLILCNSMLHFIFSAVIFSCPFKWLFELTYRLVMLLAQDIQVNKMQNSVVPFSGMFPKFWFNLFHLVHIALKMQDLNVTKMSFIMRTQWVLFLLSY